MVKTLKILLITSLAINILSAAPPKNIEPTATNYRDWINYIRPSDNEDKWREISWRNKLMPAVEEATQIDRPILLWAMNGNPCGET
jgi:hypothetical protein